MPNWKKVVTSGSNADLNTLNVTSTGAFGGSLTVTNTSGDTLTLTKDTTEPSLRMEGDTDKDFVLNIQGEVFNISQNDGTTDIFSLDHDTKNATFAGNITVSSSTNRSIILDYTSGIGNYTWMSFKQSGTEQFRVWGSYADNYLSFYNDQASLHQLKLNSDGTTTFAGDVLLENATSSKPVLTLKNTNTDAEGAVINLIKDSSSPSDNDEVGSIYMRGDNDNEEEIEAIWIRGYMTDVSDSDEDSRLRFYTYKSGTQTNTLDLESGNAMFSGNVGIGTTSPSEKLVVQDGKVLAGHTDTKGYGFHDLSNYSYTANTGRLSLVSNGTEAVSIDSSQHVGIGTTSPGSRLEISGGSLPSGGLTDLGISTGLTTGRSGTYETNTLTTLNVRGDTASYELLAGSTSAKYSGIAATAADASSFSGTLQLFTAGEAQLFIDASGNIGVGTSAPSNFYSNARNIVIRGSDNTGITISSGATSSGRLVFNDGVDQNVEGEIKYDHSNESMAFTANSSEAMRIINGNLGVGIESPDSRIHSEIAAAALNPTNLDDNTVVGLSVTIPDASLSGGEGQAIALGMNGRGRSYIANQFASVNKDASDLLFYTETGGIIYDRMKIDQDGDIDITSGSLNLEGNLLPTTNITSNVGSSSKYFLNLYAYALQSGGDLQFKTNGDNERLRIDSNGNVGIGTTSPSSHLHVFQDDTSTNEILLENAGTGDVALSFRSDANTDSNNFSSIYFDANDEGDNNTRYAKIRAFIEDNAAGAEDGKLVFTTLVGNSDTNHLVFDSAGSTFDSNITLSGTNDITVGGTIYGNNLQAITSAGLKVGNDDFSGFVQVADNGQVNLDSGNGEIHLKGSSSTFGKLFKSSGDFFINHPTADKSILFTGTSGSSSTTPLKLNMADESATFKRKIQIGESLADDPTILFQTDAQSMTMGIDRSDSNTFKISDNTSLAAPDRFSISTAGVITFNSAYTFPTSDGSANQVLKTDGAGNLSFTSAGSGTVDGSGTANDVAMWSDSNTLTDAPIAISSNDATFAGDIEVGPKSNASITLSESGGATVKLMGASVGRVGTYSDHNLEIMQNSGTAVTIDTSKNATFEGDVIVTGTNGLKINTTSDLQSSSEKFSLDGGIAVMRNSSDSAATLYVQNHSTTADTIQPYIYFTDTGGNRGGIGIEYTTAKVTLNGQGGLRFTTGTSGVAGTAALTIDSSQNVGIGTTSPTFPLDVEHSTEDILRLHNTTDGLDSLIKFSNAGGTLARVQGIDNGGLSLETGDNAGGINVAMRIDNAGNVGIGTTSPGAKFNVFTGGNSIAAAAVLQHDSFDADRKVGLGFELGNTQIKGAIGFMSDDDTSSQSNGIGNLIFCVDSNDDASPVSHNDEIMRITHTGNVSINNDDVAFPSGKGLQIYNSGNPRLKLANATTGTGSLDGTQIYMDGADIIYDQKDSGNQRFYTGGSERVRIESDGTVQITNSTSPKLQLKRGTEEYTIRQDNNNKFVIQEEGGNEFFVVESGASSNSIRIDNSGNVGIGTTNPSYDLQIGTYGTDADSTLALASATDGTGTIRFGDGSSGTEANSGRITYNHSSNNMIFDTNGATEAMRIDDSQNVGIGTTSPTSILELSKSDKTNGAVLSITNAYEGSDWAVNDAVGTINFRIDDASATEKIRSQIKVFSETGTTFPSGISMTFSTANGNTLAERLKISSAGALTFNQAYTFPTADGSANQVLQTDGAGNLSFAAASGGSTTINNNADNRVITGDGTANTLNGESNFTFDGTDMVIGEATSDYSATVYGNGGNMVLRSRSSSSTTRAPSLDFNIAGTNLYQIVANNNTGGIAANTLTINLMGTPKFFFFSDGDFTITGDLAKAGGSFKIDHPLESKKDTHHLVHSFIEGPKADLIYRGKVDLVDGTAQVNIDTVSNMTEGTFVALNTDVQCFTTNESNWDLVKGSVSGNILTIESQNTSSTASVSWMVIGERKDPHMFTSKMTNDEGKIIVEPEKENV